MYLVSVDQCLNSIYIFSICWPVLELYIYLVSVDQCCSSRCILYLLTKLYMLTSYRTSSGFDKFSELVLSTDVLSNRSYNDRRRKEWSKRIVVTFHSQSFHLLIKWIVHNQRYRVWRDIIFYLLHFKQLKYRPYSGQQMTKFKRILKSSWECNLYLVTDSV